jgi:uncharacterized lipoprotein
MTRSISRLVCRALASAAAGLALAGCHHGLARWFNAKPCNKTQIYNSAQSVPLLKVPAGVDPPDTRSALKIPPLNEPAPPPRKATDQCLDTPPPFAVPRPSTGAVPST